MKPSLACGALLALLVFTGCSSALKDPRRVGDFTTVELRRFYIPSEEATQRRRVPYERVVFLNSAPTDRSFRVTGYVAPPTRRHRSWGELVNATRAAVSLYGADAVFLDQQKEMEGWGFGASSYGARADTANNRAATTEEGTITISLEKLPAPAKPVELVLIAPGSFQMGCEPTERGRVGREFLPHQVTITRPFYLGKHEVTQAQWRAVMGTNPAQAHGVGDNHPVYNVTWNDCQEFIARLNGLKRGRFRLPTEAEWEYACRAGTRTRFSFGDALDCSDVREYCELLDAHMWWGGNNGHHGYPVGCKEVGLKSPNPWSLHDLHGNVWEWCSDWWGTPQDRGVQTDPQGPISGTRKVMRGGAWESHALHLRSADRSPMAPDDREYGRLIGLRVVREYR